MTTTILTGTCNCGIEIEREAAEGAFAQIVNDLPFLCPKCSAKESEKWEEEERREQQQLDEERRERKLAVLPSELRGARLDKLDTVGRETALDAARRWASGELRGLVLLGPIGVGKTTIAAGAVADYIERHLDRASPRWISATLALSNLSRDFNDRERGRTIEALTGKQAPLVLDDIDKCKPHVFAAEQLFLAVDLCMTNRRALIVTTNMMPSQLAANWPKPHGEAIASRLAGYCELHRVTGRDRRLRRAA
jgi:DNA replication protein DnaC